MGEFVSPPCDLGQQQDFVTSDRPVTCDLMNYSKLYSGYTKDKSLYRKAEYEIGSSK